MSVVRRVPLACVAVMLAAFAWAGVADAYGPYYVANTGGLSLNVRSAPSLTAPVIRSLGAGATIDIVCQTTGSEVNGVSAIWDQLLAGGYISDYYTDTPGVGVYSPPIPRCAAPAPQPAPSPAPAPAPSPAPAPAPAPQPSPAPSSTPEPSAVGLEGVNWADARDNFQSGWLIPTGLSASDSYSDVYARAWWMLSELPAGANTIRLPINPATVLNNTGTGPGWWWRQYQGAIDAATDLHMNVILGYWGTESDPGTIDGRSGAAYPNLMCSDPNSHYAGSPYSDFDEMWHQVIERYAGNSHVYFEIMNEPHGYTPQQWDSLAEQWLACFSQAPRHRVVVSAAYNSNSPMARCEGLQNDLADVADDQALDGTLLSLHFYDYYCPGIDDESALAGLLNSSYQGRVVLDEFGTSVTYTANGPYGAKGSPVRFGDLHNPAPSPDPTVRYMRELTTFLSNSGMGVVYWPGVRGCDPGDKTCDSYSVWSLDGNGNLQQRGDGSVVPWLQRAWGAWVPYGERVRTERRGPHHRITGCGQLPTRQSRHICRVRSRAHRVPGARRRRA